MKTKYIIQLTAVLALATFNSQLSTIFAQGSLTPPGAPAAGMKTLAQVEPRTLISSAPFTISASGSYYLTTNLTVSGGNAITIATNGVTLDLNGWTIACTAPVAASTNCAIYIGTGLRNLTIRNGFIASGVTNNGSGVYNGSGFGFGIYYAYTGLASLQNALVSKVSVAGCQYYGIHLGYGSSSVVENCTVQTVGSYGIYGSSIKGCLAMDCGATAITGDEVSDSRGQCSSGYDGIDATTAQNCYGTTSGGAGLSVSTALNCYGYAISNGYGLSATTAQNCSGIGYGSAYGLSAATAQNCYGYANATGTGLYGSDSAIGCYGYSGSGTGLYALIANVCHGATASGTALSATHNIYSY